MRGKEKTAGGAVLRAAAAWLALCAVLLPLGALLVSAADLRQGILPWISAVVVFLSTASAAWTLSKNGKKGKRAGLLIGLTAAAVLIVLGLVIDGSRVTLPDLLRTSFSAVFGGMIGASVSADRRAVSLRRKRSVKAKRT